MNLNMYPKIEDVEFQLHHQLKQYQPKPEFVTTLRRRLTSEPAVVMESIRSENTSIIKILAALGGAVVLILVLRAVFKKK